MSCVNEILDCIREYQCSSNSLNKCSVFTKRNFKRKDGDLYSFCNGQDHKDICNELDHLVIRSGRNTDNSAKHAFINSYELNINKISIRLCRLFIIKSVLLEISECKSAYGNSNVFFNKSYKVHCVGCQNSLTQLRMSVAARVLAALIRSGGGTVSSDGELAVYIGQSIIVSQAKVTSAPNMSEEEFMRSRTKDILVMSEHKDMNQATVDQLVKAAVIFDLLSIKLEKPLHLDLSLHPTAARKSNTKGAPFVLYNYARLCAILNKFDCCVNKKVIPPLSSLDDINYSLFTEEDEWSLVFDLLAEWPAVVAMGQDLNNPSLHRLTGFLASLASTFSTFYRHTRVIHEGLPHMLGLMEARIHLLLAIKQVFLNAFSLLGIVAPQIM